MPIMPIAQESEAGEPWIQDRSHTDANSESLSNNKKRDFLLDKNYKMKRILYKKRHILL